jgi:hypothetical protein
MRRVVLNEKGTEEVMMEIEGVGQIYKTKQFLLLLRPLLGLAKREARVALSKTSRTPSPVLAEHSK